MLITRKRYVIIRDGTDIFCGLARNFQFKPIDDIGDTAIKTYSSKKKAWTSFISSWNIDLKKDMGRYKVVEVSEVIETEDLAENNNE